MKSKKILLGGFAVLCMAALAGCSEDNKGNGNIPFKKVPITENVENSSSDSGGGISEETFSDNDADSLFENCDVYGGVIEFSEMGCILSPTKSEEVDGGSLSISPAWGYEKEEDNVNVHYGDNCQFQLAKINITTTKADISDADISDIKKRTSLVIFGKWSDDHNIEAEKVVITRFE